MATVINVTPASQVSSVEINNRVLDVVVSKEVKNVEINVSARENINVEITRAVSQTGVQKIIAGDNITINPTTGIGNVTISATTVTNVANANFANYSNHANIADIANSVSVANVVGIGNIATINLNGNASTILYGNGIFAAAPNTAQANYANFAGTALHANIADVANLVAGGNVSGPVANAIHATSANTATIAYSVSGANVVGEVATAGHAAVANSVSGANVSGPVQFATVANSVSGANVIGVVGNASHASVSDLANSVAGANVTGEVSFASVANSVAGANVSGTVALATHADIADVANSVSAGNIVGTINFANTADVAYSVSAANVVGTVANATHAVSSDSANSVSGANVVGAVTLANYATTANLVSGSNVVGAVADSTHAVSSDSANSVAGANVVGVVANATHAVSSDSSTTAGTVTTGAQPNITSLGTLTDLTSTGNITAPFFIGNVVGNISGNIVVPGANTNILYNNDGNAGASAGFSFNSVSNIVTVTGNVNADYFNGDGSGLSNITAGNVVGQVGNALIAGTVYTNAQPNITSLGTLDSLTVTGNVQSYANISGAYIFGDGSYLTGIGNLSAARGYWGSFFSNVNQTIASTTTAYPITLNNSDPDSYGVFISNSSRVNFQYTGNYNIQFSAQLLNTGVTPVETDIWVRKNGVDVPESRGAVYVIDRQGSVDGQAITSWNYILPMNSGDYIEFYWHSESTSVSLEHIPAGTTPITPASPSMIVSVQQVTNVQPVELKGAMTGNIVGNGYSLLNIASITSLDGIQGASFTGNGAPLTNLTGANVVGDVSGANHANIADVANSVSGSNVVGQVANALIAGTVYTNAQPNITSVGILNGLEVSGNITPTSNVLYNLGNNTHRFNDLYLSGNTIYIDGTTISTDITGNILLGNLTVDTTTGTIAGANITGYVANATHSNISDAANVAYSISGANVSGDVAGSNHANVADLANSIAGSNVVGDVSGANHANIADISYSVSGANVSGDVAGSNHANIADVANSVSGANVIGAVTEAIDATNSVHANIADVANAVDGANVVGSVGMSDYANISGIAYSVDAANIVGPISANYATYAGTVIATSQPNIAEVGILNHLIVSGNIQGYEKLFLGTGTANLPFTGPTIIAKNQSATYIQAGLINETSTGSSDWVAYADNSTDAASWADMGFTGSGFNDPAYTITGPNDGYFFVQGDASSVYGGNLVIATGNQGFKKDIIFSTGGFGTSNEFMRITNGTGTNRDLTIQDTTVSTDTSTGALIVKGGTAIQGNLNVGAKLAVSDAANLYVPGGTSGQVLTTDGLGNLSFTTITSGGTVAGSNTEVQFNNNGNFGSDITFTFDSMSGTLSAPYFSGDGSSLINLSGSEVAGDVSGANHANVADLANSVSGSNVSGSVSQSDYANVANSVAGANVVGTVSRADTASIADTVHSNAQPNITSVGTLVSLDSIGSITGSQLISTIGTGTPPLSITSTTRVANLNADTAGVADSANSVAVANVVGIGNIAITNFNGNGSQVLAGNGAWVAQTGGGGGGTPGGLNTELQFNNGGSFGGISTVTYDGVNLSLGPVANVKMTGGVSNEVLKTDGTGNLSFASIAENLVVVGRAGTVPIAINNYTMNVEARSGNVLVYVN